MRGVSDGHRSYTGFAAWPFRRMWARNLPQLVVDLNQNLPTISEYLPDPLIYAPSGMFSQTCHINLLTISGSILSDGLIVFARSFGVKFRYR
jgi:hypothetical protein